MKVLVPLLLYRKGDSMVKQFVVAVVLAILLLAHKAKILPDSFYNALIKSNE